MNVQFLLFNRILNYVVFISLFLASVFILASCQKQNFIVADDDTDQISIIPEVATRAAVVTTANISEFGVFGYAQGHKDWTDVLTTASSNLMFNNKYTKTGNSWVGGVKTQWPDNEFKRYSFFAYSPVASTANKISLLTNSSTAGYQKLSYETLTDVSKHVDLVLASRLNQTPAKVVPLTFSHALARVGFCVYAEKLGVTVKSISINGVKYQGQIEVRGDADWSASTNKSNFTSIINSSVISTDVNNPTMLTGAGGENYFMLLPQDLTSNTDNTTCVTVVVTQAGRDRSLSYTITHNYQKGKSLLYKLYIPDGVEIVVDYTVTDWTTNNIPTSINATYLNVNMLSEITPVTFFYSTDYLGAVTATEFGTSGKLSITHDAVKKSVMVNPIIGGAHKVIVTAGNLSKTVDISVPISVTPTSQSNIYYGGETFVVKINSLYAWSANSDRKEVTISPSSGSAGTDISVSITVGVNVNRSQIGANVTFVADKGAIVGSAIWSAIQVANPDYYVGRFAGAIVTKSIDANTTRCYFSKQLFVAPLDQGLIYNWSDINDDSSAQSLMNGKSNTAILNSSVYPAAYVCARLSGGDWYLPAQNQLLALWVAKPALSSLPGRQYWSSTLNSSDSARFVNMQTGSVSFSLRTNALYVRCAREY